MANPLLVGGLSGCEAARETRAAERGRCICRCCGGAGMREARADGRREHRAYLFRFVDFCRRGGRRQAVNLAMIGNGRRATIAAGKIPGFYINDFNTPKIKIKQSRFSKIRDGTDIEIIFFTTIRSLD
ncbi:hypothetical protein J2785_001334 [Burkholderia ambifaria]|nr:hypothetical protein [Burkholderia ambifaria]MDR6498190.1 hypothetical protein [Burkholderia ambifaria]